MKNFHVLDHTSLVVVLSFFHVTSLFRFSQMDKNKCPFPTFQKYFVVKKMKTKRLDA